MCVRDGEVGEGENASIWHGYQRYNLNPRGIVGSIFFGTTTLC